MRLFVLNMRALDDLNAVQILDLSGKLLVDFFE